LPPQDTSRYCTRCGESRNADEEREARAAAEEARKQNLKWECSASVKRGEEDFVSPFSPMFGIFL
jgi:hypothetical protein